jgi:hypothetical protein
MIDQNLDYSVLNKIVNQKHPGFKLLELKLPYLKFESRRFSYFPITPEADIIHTWITNKLDAFEIEITRDEYVKELEASLIYS